MRSRLFRDMSLYLAATLVLGTLANLLPGRHLTWWGKGIEPPREGVDFQWIDAVSSDVLRQSLPGVVILDTRAAPAFAAGHIPGATRITYTDISRELPADLEPRLRGADAVIICGDTADADVEQLVAQELTRRGLPPPSILIGGFDSWRAAGLEVATGGSQ